MLCLVSPPYDSHVFIVSGVTESNKDININSPGSAHIEVKVNNSPLVA
jgi:hypothetical protein